MSKIEKALNKAREESQRTLGSKVRTMPEKHPQAEELKPMMARTRVESPNPKKWEDKRILRSIKDQHVLDAYNILRTRILQQTSEQGWNTIMVTSALPGEGKTTTAINLGLSIARDSQSTALVVDANLRSPTVHEYLDLDAQTGLADYLLGKEEIPELLVSPNMEKFVVLPAGKPMADPTDLLGSVKMTQLIREMKQRYANRFIIFDCPHLVNVPESLMLCSCIDAVLMVVEADRTPKDDVQQAYSILEGRSVLGLVLNKAQG